MLAPALQPIVDLLVQFGRDHGVSTLSKATAESFVSDLLFGERALWQACKGGLVRQDEVLDAVLDRFRIETFGAGEGGPSGAEWAALRRDLARPLFSADGG